jgi:hypothetical protein
VSSLDDIKTSGQNDNNAAKTMALDHLGVIAARLRLSPTRTARPISSLSSVDEVSAPWPETYAIYLLYSEDFFTTRYSVFEVTDERPS